VCATSFLAVQLVVISDPLTSMHVPSVCTPADGALLAPAPPMPVGPQSTEFSGIVAQAGAIEVVVGDTRCPSTVRVVGVVV